MRTKSKKTNIIWKPTEEILRDYKEFAEEAATAGLFAYDSGKVPQGLIDRARSVNIATADQAMQLCHTQLRDKVLTRKEIEHVIRGTFFIYGVNRAIRFNRIRGGSHAN